MEPRLNCAKEITGPPPPPLIVLFPHGEPWMDHARVDIDSCAILLYPDERKEGKGREEFLLLFVTLIAQLFILFFDKSFDPWILSVPCI